jgi:hypothetical protein
VLFYNIHKILPLFPNKSQRRRKGGALKRKRHPNRKKNKNSSPLSQKPKNLIKTS